MNRGRRDKLVGVASLVVIGLLGAGLAVFGLSGGDEAANGGSRDRGGELFPPATVGEPTRDTSGLVDAGSFTVDLPETASEVDRLSTGGRDQVLFAVGPVSGEVASQDARPGESLDELASIYGPLEGHKTATLAGNPAYLYAATSGGRFSLVVLGRAEGRDFSVQLVGPEEELERARALALEVAESVSVK